MNCFMKKFIVLYYAPEAAIDAMKDKSEEDMKAGMAKWHEWAARCGECLVEMGTPLGNGQIVSSEGVIKSENEVSGYSILQAESMDDAVKLLEGHPHLAWGEGCSIEINECMPMPA